MFNVSRTAALHAERSFAIGRCLSHTAAGWASEVASSCKLQLAIELRIGFGTTLCEGLMSPVKKIDWREAILSVKTSLYALLGTAVVVTLFKALLAAHPS